MLLDIAKGRSHVTIDAYMISGDTFRALAKAYLVSGLERGIPSLFVDVKGVYHGHPEKMAVVGEIMEQIVLQLENDAGLHDDG